MTKDWARNWWGLGGKDGASGGAGGTIRRRFEIRSNRFPAGDSVRRTLRSQGSGSASPYMVRISFDPFSHGHRRACWPKYAIAVCWPRQSCRATFRWNFRHRKSEAALHAGALCGPAPRMRLPGLAQAVPHLVAVWLRFSTI